MLPVLRSEQIRAADAYTIAHEPIASIDLMERAAGRCVHWLADLLFHRDVDDARTAVVVFAGPGNNGGDGLVIARMMHQAGHPVQVVERPTSKGSEDRRINRDRAAQAGVVIHTVADEDPLPGIDPTAVVVDALFGTGVDRPLEGPYKRMVRHINDSGAMVVAIDLPSGLFDDDNTGNDPEAIVRAAHTLTFQCPKPALFLAECAPFTGEWHVLPIGLDAAFIAGLDAESHLLEEEDVRALLPARERFDHKGDHGHTVVVAGQQGMIGAAILATRAALRSGAGLVSAAVPAAAIPTLQVAAPEAMCLIGTGSAHHDRITLPDRCTAVGIGPGMGTHADTAHLLKRLIQDNPAPLVIDADALNILAAEPTWLAFLPASTILTPHPGEFDRLAGPSGNSRERRIKAREFAMRNGVVLVLKGAWTTVFTPGGKAFLNSTGGPGMAKGGCGDVLTGLLTGLRAQGLDALATALLGVHLHGRAGDIAAEMLGMDGMTAMDLVEALPLAWQELREGGRN